MKIKFLFPHRQTRSGIALISVLAMVVLLTALVVAFLLRAGSERQAAGFYKAETGSRALADTVINLVQAQINEATSQGPTVSWASQPGAIRTFDNSGNLKMLYRLYSASSLTTTSASSLANDVPSSGGSWLGQRALWVDLNAPVNNDPLQAPINTHFPILDPRDPTDPTLTKTVAMDGFSITNAPVDTTSTAHIDTNLTADPAPMPVQWLYVLQNGNIIAPDTGSNGLQLTFNSATTKPSATNPIVGRIAFWTDDETCKININTAGGDGAMVPASASVSGKADPTDIANNTFWSTPYYNTLDENGINGGGVISAGFATSIPVPSEYQRYPGHPATVGLKYVLNTLLYGNTGTGISSGTTTASGTTGSFYCSSGSTAIYPGITPRYSFGGSQGGTVTTDTLGASVSIVQSSFRLYPTVSEMLFDPTLTSNVRDSSVLNTGNSAARQRMESARFFLTAHSRSPELNLFGLPRIGMWPVSSASNAWTAVDSLLTFCSTIGGNAYYFTRTSALDGTVDVGIARNQSILGYLDMLTQQNIPGFGGSFSGKSYYKPGSTKLLGQSQTRQILTEIFDYIRMINIDDATYNSNGTEGTGAYGGSTWPGYGGGTNQIAPAQYSTWGTQGVGAYPRLNEVSFNFIPMGQGGMPRTTVDPTPSDAINAIPVSPGEMKYYIPGGSGAHGYGPTGSYIYSGSTITDLSPSATGESSSTLTYNYTGTYPQYAPPGTAGTGSNTNTPPATGPYNQIYSVYNNQTGAYSGVPPDGTTVIQVMVYLGFINPAQEWITSLPSVYVTVDGLQNLGLCSGSTGKFYPLHFPSAIHFLMRAGANGWAGGYNPGYINFTGMFNGNMTRTDPGNGIWFPFFSSLVPLPTASSMTLCSSSGSPNTLTVTESDGKGGSYNTGNVVQTYKIDVPTAAAAGGVPTASSSPGITSSPCGTLPMPYLYSVAAAANGAPRYRVPAPGALNVAYTSSLVTLPSGQTACTETTGPVVGVTNGNTVPTYPVALLSTAYFQGAWGANVDVTSAIEGRNFQQNDGISFDRWYMAPVSSGGATYLGQCDVIQSMVLSQAWSDTRVLAVKNVPNTAFVTHPGWAYSASNQFAHSLGVQNFQPMVGYSNLSKWSSPNPSTSGDPPLTFTGLNPCLGTLSGLKPDTANLQIIRNVAVAPVSFSLPGQNPVIPTTPSGAPPDWDTGISLCSDGPWINKSDEGCAIGLKADGTSYDSYFQLPFASTSGTFSANRQIPSPGMLGSLPTGVDPNSTSSAGNPVSWQTLLFRPGPGAADNLQPTAPATSRVHPGEGTPVGTVQGTPYGPPYAAPPDHLWMDLFWMPEAEPYAISEPFSTAGKINLNYQIEPFTYIKRATALRAAMAGEKIAQVSLLNGLQGYKTGAGFKSRRPIDLDATMTQFDAKFATGDIFRSASQICEEFLVPLQIAASPYNDTTTYAASSAGVAAFAQDWYTVPPTDYTVKSSGNTLVTSGGTIPNAPFALVGDNVRERPYTDLYAKVTTKSNTFTVYYRVQALKAPSTVTAGTWDETQGSVTGEYRGSTTLERFIDPNETTSSGTTSAFSDYATSTMPAGNLEAYYQWRVVENRQFTP